jgi:hypothetical protein
MTVHNIFQKPAMLPAPMLTRVVSAPLFNSRDEAVTWTVGQAHPLLDTYKVIRMFIDLGGVEIYSSDGKNGVRHIIPSSMVRFAEEAMALNTFGEELYAAEAEGAPVGPLSAGDDDDDDDPDDEPDEPDDEPETPTLAPDQPS